jgi:hypothetical protein
MMRNTLGPWLLAGTLVVLVLIFTMNNHSSIMAELENVKSLIASMETSAKNHKNNIPVEDAGKPISLKGAFEEKRNLVVSAQDFKPDSLKQDKDVESDFKTKLQSLIDQQVPADDPALVKIIRNHFIQQPSTEPYNLLNPERLDFSHGQTPFIDSRLKFMVRIRLQLIKLALELQIK